MTRQSLVTHRSTALTVQQRQTSPAHPEPESEAPPLRAEPRASQAAGARPGGQSYDPDCWQQYLQPQRRSLLTNMQFTVILLLCALIIAIGVAAWFWGNNSAQVERIADAQQFAEQSHRTTQRVLDLAQEQTGAMTEIARSTSSVAASFSKNLELPVWSWQSKFLIISIAIIGIMASVGGMISGSEGAAFGAVCGLFCMAVVWMKCVS